MTFAIQKQTQAEKDQYLFDCFHDIGAIKDLATGGYSIVTGRKGSGKTAIARYLQNKYSNHDLDYVVRLSIDDIGFENTLSSKDKIESIIFFILVRTIQSLIQTPLIESEYTTYWTDFLKQNGLQNIADYKAFEELSKKNTASFSVKEMIGGTIEKEYKKCSISTLSTFLLQPFIDSVLSKKEIYIFIDDISDHLDHSDIKELKSDINTIRDVLFRLDSINTNLTDKGKGLRFISCVRDDLFEFMEGSNINKLKSSSLSITWDEAGFCGLLIRRLPFYKDDIATALLNPTEAIKKQFPDEIFQTAVKTFNTNRHATNFYSYMVAISFNRPRDFLMFCYALRERLSYKHPATTENIDSAEGEYVDYFLSELRDELYLAAKIFGFDSDSDNLHKLLNVLAQTEDFTFGKLKTDVSTYLETKNKNGNKKIAQFIFELWWYGIIGFKDKDNGQLINFKYLKNYVRYVPDKVKSYSFYLHRGLWWFLRKQFGGKKTL